MFVTIEGTGFEIIDPSLAGCFINYAKAERLWTGAK